MKVTYIQHCGDDLTIVNAARVSFKKESGWCVVDHGEWYEEVLDNSDAKLISYLAKHKHHSPFNHTFLTMHVKAPIFVARQLVKHKFMPWNEVSRRYVDEEPEFYTPEVWRGRPDASIKQGSAGTVDLHNYSYNGRTSSLPGFDPDLEQHYAEAMDGAYFIYDSLLNAGVAPEMARMVLPQNMYTEWYWSGTLGAWADMYKLRIDGHAQWETQQIAKQVGEIIEPLFPVSWPALTDSRNGS